MTDQERLALIERRLERIESILEEAREAIVPILANPGRLLAKMMGGGK